MPRPRVRAKSCSGQQVVVEVEVGEHLVVVVADLVGAQAVGRRGVGAGPRRRGTSPSAPARTGATGAGRSRGSSRTRRGTSGSRWSPRSRSPGSPRRGCRRRAQQGAHLAVEDPVLPQVDDGLRAERAEVVDDVGAGGGVRRRLRLLAGPAAPGGEQDPGAAGRVGRCRPGEAPVHDESGQVRPGGGVEQGAGDDVVAVRTSR